MKENIGIVGLGYVGLPLAIELSKKFSVVGFDTNPTRILNLSHGIDSNKEHLEDELSKFAERVTLTHTIEDLKFCNTYIITVPTPVTKKNKPDLTLLKLACTSVAKVLKVGDLVILESTVFPGCTEEICVPIIERISGINRKSFSIGYSPERINPGDKKNGITSVSKIISGSSDSSLERMHSIYSSFVKADLFVAKSIKVAETAKVLENIQRDLNIALMNEMAIICDHLNIETHDVINAAASKWNFAKYQPGLVGGHCIGIDPYYLAEKSKQVGYSPKIILAARKLNDSMHKFIIKKILKIFLEKNSRSNFKEIKVLILGFSFKENISDTRNTRVFHLIKSLSKKLKNIDVYDPVMDPISATSSYSEINFIDFPYINNNKYDIVILAVPHKEFITINIKEFLKVNGLIFEISSSIFQSSGSVRL